MPLKECPITGFGGLYLEADARALPAGASPLCYDVDFSIGGVTIRPGLTQPIRTTYSSNLYQWLKSASLPESLHYNIFQDSAGNLWYENLSSPGTLTQFYSGILNNARLISSSFPQREYFAFSDLTAGNDQPRQWDGTNFDRISQVGPGAPCSVPAQSVTLYDIVSITQPYAPQAVVSVCFGSSLDLENAPAAGSNLWILGSHTSTASWLGDVTIGDYIYIYGLAALGGLNVNGTYAVIATGDFTYSGGSGTETAPYIEVQMTQVGSDFARDSASGYYVKTQAVVTLNTPIPPQDAAIGANLTIAGATPSSWNGLWQILGTPTLGFLLIEATSLTSNVATYTYSLDSGESPGWQPATRYYIASQVVDQYGHVWQVITPGTSASGTAPFPATPAGNVTDGTVVWANIPGAVINATVFGTANGNGIFNIYNLPITSATSTTFTVTITAPNVLTANEQGSGVTGQASVFIIDPATKTINTGNPGVDPIYGNDTGTGIIIPPPLPNVAEGQRYAVVLFQTRNEYITAASPPISFYTTGQSNKLTFSGIPIGPPDVIARIIAFTAANSGIGGPYFYVPTPVTVLGNTATLGQPTIYQATIVNDNTSTTLGPITFSDIVLLNSVNITQVGNNLLTGGVREIGEFLKCVNYFGRNFIIGERVKVDNFVNLTFDGGSISGLPAGWGISSGLGAYVSLVASPIVNWSLHIENGSAVVLNPAATPTGGMLALYQSAYQDAYSAPIIDPDTAYSVRVTAALDGSGTGSLNVDLYSPSLGQSWIATIPFSSLGGTLKEFILPFNNPLWIPVPSDLQLRVYPVNMPPNDAVLIDRIEPFPTNQPYYSTQCNASYAENYEAVDEVTGVVDTSLFSSEPQTDIFVFLETLYIKTATKTFALNGAQQSGEPSTWNIREVSNTVGECGPLASDSGEEYSIDASQQGGFIFDGGNHTKITQEIQKLWNSLYQPALNTIWVKNDIANKRIMFGVPLPTPNQWLPEAPPNATPLVPNVVLMCSYLGLDTGAQIAEGPSVVVAMFAGHLIYKDGRRKWTIWQIASPYGNFIPRPDSSTQFLFGQAGVISQLNPLIKNDNGSAIEETYMTYGFADKATEEQLQLGSVRKLFAYGTASISGNGTFNAYFMTETPQCAYPDQQLSFPLKQVQTDDTNIPMNSTGNACFVMFQVDGQVNSYYAINRYVQEVQRDPWLPLSGQ